MWERKVLKSNARLSLKSTYWIAFAVMLLIGVISAGYVGITDFVTKLVLFFQNPSQYFYALKYSIFSERIASLFLYFDFANLITCIYILASTILINIFIVYPLTIGISRFFVQNHFGVTEFEAMFSGFKRKYLNGVGALLSTRIFIILWGLLLIIPGFIKSYQYSMVPFILADNPDITGKRAREISRIMTTDDILNIIVLDFSFFGWMLIGAFTFNIGNYFVMPYYQATKAELYIFLRDRVVRTNQVTPEELDLAPMENAEHDEFIQTEN